MNAKKYSLITGSTLVLFSLSAQAAVISYNVSSNDSPTTPTGADAAGVLGAAGDTWVTLGNQSLGANTVELNGMVGALTDVTGATTSVFLTHDNFYTHTDGGADNTLAAIGPFQNSWFSRESAVGGSPTLSFSGFAAGDLVDIVIFSNNQIGVNRGTVNVSAVGATTSDTNIIPDAASGPTSYILGAATPANPSNTARFDGLSPDASGNIVVTINSSGNFSDFNGFQLNVTSVPEPSSALLCGMAALGFLRRRRA